MTVKIRLTNRGVIQEYIPKESLETPRVSFEVDAFDKDNNLIVGGGGGSGIVIPDGGTLGGTYDSDVFCQGSVTMTDDVTVNGNLTVAGAFNNNTGRMLMVLGDLKTFSIVDFNRTNTALPQSSISIYGSWIAHDNIDFLQTAGVPTAVLVKGDFIGAKDFPATIFNMSGINDNQAGGLLVGGDLYLQSVLMYGGDSDVAPAGSGGNITVYGNMHVPGVISCDGGSAENTGHSAGAGGAVSVRGNLICDSFLSCRGGYSEGVGSNSGGGGLVVVGGDLKVASSIDLRGGDSNDGIGGSGGTSTLDGDLVCQNYYASGGEGRTSGGAAGNVQCRGNAVVRQDIILDGGSSLIGGGGNAGSVEVRGNFVVGDEFSANSGNGTSAGQRGDSAPEGSTLFVGGNLNAYRLSATGGVSTSGPAGSGGHVLVKGNFNLAQSIVLSGGSSGFSSAGSGGRINVLGNFVSTSESTIALDGGSTAESTSGDGGDGGQFIVAGNACVYDLVAIGGNSSGLTAQAGSGGFISVDGAFTGAIISLNGGQGVVTNGPAGSLFAIGGCRCYLLLARDGTGPGAAPTATTNIFLGGSCFFGTLDVANRSSAQIKPPSSSTPVYLKINELGVGGKNTLNNLAGTPTASIASDIASCAFVTDVAGNWYKLAGVSI